jgi:hypothetical protein
MLFSLFMVVALRDAELENMEFVRTQNEWIGEVAGSQSLYSLPPYYGELTSPRYEVRRQAKKHIESRGLAELANLAVASKYPDPNVSLVANEILKSIYACYECRGSKMCVFHITEQEYKVCKRCGMEPVCRLCNGTGDRRYVITKDEWEYRKNILPGR